MYQVHDTVLYSTQGVCEIEEIVKKKVSGKQMSYYVLKPVYDKKSTVFVPVDNPALTARMHRPLSAAEVYELVHAMPQEQCIWVEDEFARRDQYKQILTSGNREQLVRLIKTLYMHQQVQKSKGRKLHSTDEHFLKEAEKLLYEEFAHVLHIRCEQVLPFIMQQLGEENPAGTEQEPGSPIMEPDGLCGGT